MPPFVKISILFIIGILLFPLPIFCNISAHIYMFAILTSLSLGAYFKSKRTLSSFCLSICIILVGTTTHCYNNQKLQVDLDLINDYLDEKRNYTIEVTDISQSSTFYKINASLKSIEGDKSFKNKIGLIIFSKDLFSFEKNMTYNCPLRISEIKKNKNPETVNFKKIYSRQSIYFNANFDSQDSSLIQAVKVDKNIFSFFRNIQNELASILKSNLQDKQNYSIVSALVLGDKSELSNQTKTIFKNTGSIHILAVSGLHVGLIYSILLFVMYWFPKNNFSKTLNLTLSLICIFSYCMITGASTSVVRAGMMLSLYLIGKHFGKFTNVYNIIGSVATVILLFNPQAIYTVSFQFSFLALISIIFFNQYFDITHEKSTKLTRYLLQLITVSMSAQILIAPLLIYYFKQFSLYFWLSGIIAIPMAFIILVSTIFSLLLHLINFHSVANLLSKCIELATEFLYESMNSINNIPYCSLSNIYISAADVVSIYICIICIMVFLKYKYKWVIYPLLFAISTSSLYKSYSKIKSWDKSELIVYHLHGMSFINYVHNGTMTEVNNQNVSKSKINDLLFNFRNSRFIDNYYSIHNKGDDSSAIQIQGKTICINPNIKQLKNCKNIDLLVLTKDQEISKNNFLNTNIGKVVLDGNIDYFKKKTIIQQLTEMQIDFHNTSQSGAFIYTFKNEH